MIQWFYVIVLGNKVAGHDWFWGSGFWWSYFYLILGLMLNQVKRVFMKQVLLLEMTLNKESLNWAASSSLSILYFREMSWGLNNSILNYKTFSLNMINYSVNFVVLKKFLTYTWGSYNRNSNWLKMNNIKTRPSITRIWTARNLIMSVSRLYKHTRDVGT